jgi:hypothetical protein
VILPLPFLPWRIRLLVGHLLAQRPQRRLELLEFRLSESRENDRWAQIQIIGLNIRARGLTKALHASRVALKASKDKCATTITLREQLEGETCRRKAAELELKNLRAVMRLLAERLQRHERGT